MLAVLASGAFDAAGDDGPEAFAGGGGVGRHHPFTTRGRCAGIVS
jgi:hypothetical protein